MTKIVLVLVLILTGRASSLISQVSAVKDLISFAYETVDFIRSFSDSDAEDTVSPEHIDLLYGKITARIKAANSDIVGKIRLRAKLDQIEDAVKVIYSSLQDLKSIVASANFTDEFETYLNRFVKHFEEHAVLVEIRWLPKLLTFTVPGTSGSFLQLFASSTRCNLTALETFEEFYLDLVSDGIALHFAYLASTSNSSLQLEEAEWTAQATVIQTKIDMWEASCKANVSILLSEDFKNTNDAEVLWRNSKERYPFLWNDVMFFSDIGTHQFHFQQNENNTALWEQKNNINKYQVFGPIDAKLLWNGTKVSSELQSLKNNFHDSVEGKDDAEASRNVAESVMAYLHSKGHTTRNIIVFFENAKFAIDKILLHNDSPVASLSIDNIELRFCYSDSLQCVLGKLGYNDNVKTSKGTFRVFVYPGSHGNQPRPSTIGRGSCVLVSVHLLVTVVLISRLY